MVQAVELKSALELKASPESVHDKDLKIVVAFHFKVYWQPAKHYKG